MVRNRIFVGLAALIRERSRNGWWAYLIWLFVYLLTAALFAEEAHFHGGAGASKLWPLVIPIFVIICQWARPTILGWALVSVPTVLYFCLGLYYAIANNIGPHPQWEYDSSGVVLGVIFLLALLGACISLVYAARPR